MLRSREEASRHICGGRGPVAVLNQGHSEPREASRMQRLENRGSEPRQRQTEAGPKLLVVTSPRVRG